jgi:hydroxyacylglutathione hydrolase
MSERSGAGHHPMIVKRFHDAKLAQTSYLIGSADVRQAIVVDPNRDIAPYLAAAAADGLRISHVTETHIHADFVSGSRELAHATGAALYLSDEGGPDWRYGYANEAAVLLADGDSFDVGRVRFDVLHTPGHTPEHLTFFVTDTATAAEPVAAMTGDFVFVADVGRPDLLERAVGVAGTMEQAARSLFQSLHRLRAYPDYLQIWPGHGAGSLCGKGIGSMPQSTLGYERRFNWAFQIDDERQFVRQVLEGQPEPPRYFATLKQLNKEGPRLLGGVSPPQRLPWPRVRTLIESGELVIDTRAASDYAHAHLPGTINIPLNRTFTTWAGWLVPYTRDCYLIVDDRCTHCLTEAIHDLAIIGLDRIGGYFGADMIQALASSGAEIGRVPHVDAASLASRLRAGEVNVVDVRSDAEWKSGHIPGARHIPLGSLAEASSSLPPNQPVVVHCQGGGRSAIGASVLKARSSGVVIDFAGGFSEWQEAGYPVERGIGVPAEMPSALPIDRDPST